MIYTQRPPGGVFHSIDEIEEYHKMVEKMKIRSYDEYISKGHEWCWSLVGNIVDEDEFGEEHEIKKGTKQFSSGSKVCLAPGQWGDGYERVIVIGVARGSRKYIEVIMQSKYIENFRMQKIYKPAIMKRMINSEHYWWSDSEDDRKEIIEYLEYLAPEEAEKQKSIDREKNIEMG
ncbi:MAG: hypothetical protein K5776_07140 [Lachnospiraceae bacterium]|nr:hypothetical protein [Lachnospiraceae bacterium]